MNPDGAVLTLGLHDERVRETTAEQRRVDVGRDAERGRHGHACCAERGARVGFTKALAQAGGRAPGKGDAEALEHERNNRLVAALAVERLAHVDDRIRSKEADRALDVDDASHLGVEHLAPGVHPERHEQVPDDEAEVRVRTKIRLASGQQQDSRAHASQPPRRRRSCARSIPSTRRASWRSSSKRFAFSKPRSTIDARSRVAT